MVMTGSLMFIAQHVANTNDFSCKFDIKELLETRELLLSLCNSSKDCLFEGKFKALLENDNAESFKMLDFIILYCSSRTLVSDLISSNLEKVLHEYSKYYDGDFANYVVRILNIKFGNSTESEDTLLDICYEELDEEHFIKLLDYSMCANNYLSLTDLLGMVNEYPTWVFSLLDKEIFDIMDQLNAIILEDTFRIFLFNAIYTDSNTKNFNLAELDKARSVCRTYGLDLMDEDYYRKMKEVSKDVQRV